MIMMLVNWRCREASDFRRERSDRPAPATAPDLSPKTDIA
jgi:hypothetical protein